MIRPALLFVPFVLAAAVLAPKLASAQSGTDAAKADGKSFGAAEVGKAQSAATTAPDASRIPNFSLNAGQQNWFDNPDAMTSAAASQASGSAGYAAVRDSIRNRARFAPIDLDAVIARSKTINADPLSYASGMSVSGTEGRCVPLPPTSGSAVRYKATCNIGYTLDASSPSCTVTLKASVTSVTDYLYYCTGTLGECDAFKVPQCRHSGTHAGKCLQGYTKGSVFYCTEPGDPVDEYTCSAPIVGETAVRMTTRNIVTTTKDESACASLAASSVCTMSAETCTDSDPVTRVVDGVAVTQPCWAWQRDYQCNTYTPAEDCSTLEQTPGCNLEQEYCLTSDTPCRTFERVYDCPVPDQPTDPTQFICDGDVYCIDGSCETIEREANDEFKDAVVALNAMDQARREFDPDKLTLFKGERASCASKVFGILNCCKGKGFPLIPGIQLLVSLGCNSEEMLLHERDANGLCAYVGTYCASSFLGVCLTKRKVYCCFESKLSRILQEQGRTQLNKPWASPRDEQCAGFTIDEFSRLDLSKMDFSEVYAEFTDAARLPDELQAAADIQQKIEDYYARTAP